MPQLQRSDLILAVLGLVGIVAVVTLYQAAFPLSLVELRVTRDEAVTAATEFLQERGADLASFRSAAVFNGDTEPLVFLQRSLGNEEAARWARELVPIWTWDIRWFRPEEAEEWLAYVGVDGQIVGFRHVVEEAAAGADLGEDEARVLADEFLQQRGVDLDGFELVQSTANKRDNRTDHLFTWEQTGTEIVWNADDPEAGTGSARVVTLVQGDRIGGYFRTMKIPEAFSRELDATLSVGTFLAVGAIVMALLLAVVAMVMAIMRYRTGDVNWPVAIAAGTITGVMVTISTATGWPQQLFNYQTQMPWTIFVGTFAVGLLLALVFYTFFVLFPTAAGESLARELFPRAIRGFADAMRGRVFTAEFGAASLRGYALAAGLLGYLTVFYWFAQRFLGAWMPAEGPYSQIFNNVLPVLTPLTISLVAAISEETIYRLFGISLVKKLTRSTFLALLIPAAIWAFGHSNYPVFPVYIRGIELTIGGMLFGLAFLHYGLVACIVAHYVIDAVALGMPLVLSGSTSYMVSGLLVIGLALVPGIIGLVAGRRGASGTITSAPATS